MMCLSWKFKWIGAGLVALGCLVGCSPYALRGKVVPSDSKHSEILVVKADDPRLNWPGMGRTQVRATIDPDRLSRQDAGPVRADFDGRFSIPIEQPGAGLLEYDVLIVGQLDGYAPASRTTKLPGTGQRVLILLSPGDSRYVAPYDDIVDETLELSEPYRQRR